jgi:hypothetical protein
MISSSRGKNRRMAIKNVWRNCSAAPAAGKPLRPTIFQSRLNRIRVQNNLLALNLLAINWFHRIHCQAHPKPSMSCRINPCLSLHVRQLFMRRSLVFLPNIFLPQTPLLLKCRIGGGERANSSAQLYSAILMIDELRLGVLAQPQARSAQHQLIDKHPIR